MTKNWEREATIHESFITTRDFITIVKPVETILFEMYPLSTYKIRCCSPINYKVFNFPACID